MALKPLDIAMGVTVALTWGMGLVFAKAAIEHFPPILLMAFRFLVTGLVLVWFVKIPYGQLQRIFMIAIVAAAIQYSLTYTGLKGLDASITALIVQLEVPFLVILGVVFLHETAGLRKWFGIAVAFGGVALIAGEPKLGSAWLSIGLVIGGAVTWAVGQAMIRRLDAIDGITVTAWVAVFATVQLFAMSLVFEEGHAQAIGSAGITVWGAVLYMGLVMTALGYGIWNTLVRNHPISQIAPFLLLLPMFSVIGGSLFLGERMTVLTALGGCVIIAGVAFILFERLPMTPVETSGRQSKSNFD